MTGHVAGLFRHPVKGFTPEPLSHADLAAGEAFPCDRLYAVENGPSGFDPAAPAWLSKQHFTVLMALPQVARARTRYDEASGLFSASAPGLADFEGSLRSPAGRTAFAAWVARLLGEAASGPLSVVESPAHRFLDHPQGHVSVINLASLRELEARVGRPIDPLRFRANLYVEGWPAWAENGWAGRELMVGFARARVLKTITRCAAIQVDPQTAERDMDLVKALFDHFGHVHCGVYLNVTDGGRVSLGDACTAPAP